MTSLAMLLPYPVPLPLVAHTKTRLRTEALILRDRYICGIIFRCFRLCDKWQWQLDNASGLFNELGEIFRSRKFANLRHEKPDCPKFMLSSDWSRLSQTAKTDSAFTLFLKLIVMAAKPDQPAAELSPKVKKLLSLAVRSAPSRLPKQRHHLEWTFLCFSIVTAL